MSEIQKNAPDPDEEELDEEEEEHLQFFRLQELNDQINTEMKNHSQE